MINRLTVLLVGTSALSASLLFSRPLIQTPAPAAVAQEDAPPVLAVPQGYKYDPRGRRDPFLNPIPKPLPTEADIPVARPPGLKGLLVSDAVIIGIVTSKEASMNRVVIGAPGNRTYFASRGDTLFDAVVKDIQQDAVVFTLKNRQADQSASPELVRKVRTTAGEKK